MPEELFYLLLTLLLIVSGFLLVQIARARSSRRQKSRRLERAIAKYFRKKGGATK
jgi:membrane protein implicated in regulation of membrane protease activity